MKAMILAAGRGERMRPLTDHTPKPLLQVGGQALIVWHIQRLARAGITDLVINHAHLGHEIEKALGDGAQWGVSISYSAEVFALETAGGIAHALGLLGDAPFLVVNGDVFCEVDYPPFIARALNRMTQGKLAHIMLVPNPPHHPDGDFVLDMSGAVSDDVGSRLTFSGIAAYRPEFFAKVPAGEKARLAPLLVAAMQTHRVSGEKFLGRWVDVGTPARLAELDACLASESNLS